MFFKDLKDRISQGCLGSEFNVILNIFGNVPEEFVQLLGQFHRWETVIFDMVRLLKDEPM